MGFKEYMIKDDAYEIEEGHKGLLVRFGYTTLSVPFDFEKIIFDKDFAKAFWGRNDAREVGYNKHGDKTFMLDWAYHLQQMVLEEEPLKYLEKFL